MRIRVFVYGTLKEGFPNFGTNTGTRIPGLFVTKERYPLYLVGQRHSPWMINTPGKGTQVIGQVFEVVRYSFGALTCKKLEAGSEPVNQSRRSRACFPRERSTVPALIEVQVIVRVWNTDPAHKRWLDPVPRAIRKIQVPDSLRSQQPLMACSRCNIDKFGFDICWNRAECLDCVHDE